MDVNYIATTSRFTFRYANARYPLIHLRDVIDFVQYGISARASSEPFGVPILRMNNLQDDGWDLSDLKYIELAESEVEKYRVRNGDLLFNRTNSKELVGKCEVFREEGDWVFASYLIRVQLDQGKALPGFVATFLNTEAGRLQIDRVSRQIIGMSNVNAEELKDLEIPLPPLDIQHTLVAEMEAARAARQSKLAQAEELLNGIDVFVLEQLRLELPVGEQRTIFSIRLNYAKDGRCDPHFHHPAFTEIIESIQSISHKALGKIAKFSSETWNPKEEKSPTFRYIEISGVDTQTGEITASETPVLEAPSRAQKVVRVGDILISLTRPHRGAIAQVTQDFDTCIASTGFAVIREINDKIVSKDYLWCILRNQISLQQLLQRSSGGNYPAITESELKKIFVPIAPDAVQKYITVEVTRRRETARRLREEAAQAWSQAKENFEKALLG